MLSFLILPVWSQYYCDLKTTTININDAGSTLNELDINDEISVKIRNSAVSDFKSLETQPDEVEDLFLVIHCILMDITLPGIDDDAALKILRKLDKIRNTPVIAVSANAMDTDIQSGIAAGFDEYLTSLLISKNCMML